MITPVPLGRSAATPSPSGRPSSNLFTEPLTVQNFAGPRAPLEGTPAGDQATLLAVHSGPNRYIVQFNQIPSKTQIESLRQEGITLNEYIGGNSYYATSNKQPTAMSEQDETIRAIEPVTPKGKIHPEILQEQKSTGTSAGQKQAVSVQVFNDVSLESLIAQVQNLNGVVVESSEASFSATIIIDKGGLEALARLNGVKTIEPAAPPKQRFNDGVRRNIGADVITVAPYNLRGAGVKVGIWDGGLVAQTHSDFKNRLTIVDTAAATARHATHVAGTIGADGSRSKSFNEEQQLVQIFQLNGPEQPAVGSLISPASESSSTGESMPMQTGMDQQWQGVAPGVHIYSFDWNNSTNDHKAAITTHGIQLSQNSWGYTVSGEYENCNLYGEYTAAAEAYDRIVTGFYGQRIPIIFAAGNERNDGDCGLSPTPPYINYRTLPPPVTAKNLIVVGAINSDDDEMTDFSSWGPTKDGRLKPDLVAPGCDRTGDQMVTSTVPADGYGGMCGTSMAAPAVSGAVAILIEQQTKMANSKPLIPSSLKAALIHGAVDIKAPGPDFQTGYGKVALKSSVDLVKEKKITEKQLETTGQMAIASLNVKQSAQELKVTLVWDDAPGSTSSTVSLVNDLDLQLISPSGKVQQPWVLDPAHPEKSPQTGPDHVNVVEQVLVKAPEAGTWQIQVRGYAIPLPPQPFSLVVSAR